MNYTNLLFFRFATNPVMPAALRQRDLQQRHNARRQRWDRRQILIVRDDQIRSFRMIRIAEVFIDV